MVVFEAAVVVGRERVCVRLLSRESALMLERELIQADGTSFVHAIAAETQASIYEYMTADPYFMQLERHYGMIQEKIRFLGLP